ncbi:MAG TPA: hypothetical protein VF384_16360 [Planctomycetota bacterium]
MGYEVHITRAAEWLDSETKPITIEEWLAYLASDPEMRLDGFAEARTPEHRTLRLESKGLAVWTAWHGEGRGQGHAWMDHREGRITVKNPDPEMLAKMCTIATQLGAIVQGDEGEPYPDPMDAAAAAPDVRHESPRARSPWWKRLFGR